MTEEEKKDDRFLPDNAGESEPPDEPPVEPAEEDPATDEVKE